MPSIKRGEETATLSLFFLFEWLAMIVGMTHGGGHNEAGVISRRTVPLFCEDNGDRCIVYNDGYNVCVVCIATFPLSGWNLVSFPG